MKDNISPEDKLLKLIKGEKKPKPLDSPTREALDKKPGHITFKLKASIKNSLFSFTNKYLSHVDLNKFIIGLAAVSLLYLIAAFVYPWIGLGKIKLPTISKEKIEEPTLKPKEEIRPYEFYLQGLRQRNIFGNPVVSAGGAPNIATNVELAKDMNLVGIISGLNPQAIIEDNKAQKTYYVTKGQFIGEFQVEEIGEGKVILNCNGQRYELNM